MIDHTTPQPSALKVCTKCGQSKPKTAEYFYGQRSKADGLSPSCKECEAERKRAHYVAHKEETNERNRAYRDAHREEANEQNRAYYVAHKEEISARARAWREAHKEEISEYMRAYRATHKEERREGSRAYYAAHKEKMNKGGRAYYATHKEEMNKGRCAWREANPLAVRAQEHRRRALKLAAEGSHTAADIRAQYKRQKGCCYWCGVKVGETYHMDHVVPLSRGGANSPENLVVACPTCNMEKHNKLPHEWAKGGRLL